MIGKGKFSFLCSAAMFSVVLFKSLAIISCWFGNEALMAANAVISSSYRVRYLSGCE